MFFEKKKRKGRHPEMGPPGDRFETEEDLKALARAKKIEKDTGRHAKVKSLAKEKILERRSRGKSQAMITRKDNTIPKGTIKEHKFPQEHVD